MSANSEQVRELDTRDLRILMFEARSWRNAGVKEQAIRLEFGMAAARYYQLLNALIESPAAARYDPLLMSRLRRLRTGRIDSATP